MPRILLHLEGLAILVASLFSFEMVSGHWWTFAIYFLLPDLSMLGYLAGPRAGALAYNLAHTYAAPAVLMLLGYIDIGSGMTVVFALIWLAHIGFDRLLGFGLKYPTSFKETHLQRV